MGDAGRGQPCAHARCIARAKRHDGRALVGGGRCHEFDVAPCERPLDDHVRETASVRRRIPGADLAKQLEADVHRGHILEGQRNELEASRVAAPRQLVVHEPGEIVRTAHPHPADVVGLEHADQLAPNIRKAGSPGGQQPFLRAARENVDVGLAQIEGERTETLDRIDDEVDATLPTERAQGAQIDARARRELHPRHCHSAHPIVIENSRKALGREHTALTLYHAVLEAALAGRLPPWINVRRKLAVRADDDVAGLERQRERGQVQAEAGVRRQRDLGCVSTDALRDQFAGFRQLPELPFVGDALRICPQASPFGKRLDRTPWQRPGGRVVEIDGLARLGPCELVPPHCLDVVAHGRAISGSPAPRGTPARTDRGSSASRNASPSKLNPNTAAPIASPGKTDVHGACRSWYRSRPSAIIEPQLGVGGCTPRPRNESEDSAMIAPATPSVAAMTTGATTLGKMCLARILVSVAPSVFSACTNSSSRTTSTWPRTSRAMPAQPTTPMVMNTMLSDGCSAATSAMSSSNVGNASVTSASRITSSSIQPA